MTEKQEYRKIAKELLQARPKETRRECSIKICQNAINLPEVLNAKRVFCYLNLQDEVATWYFLDVMRLLEKEVYVPKIENGEMKAVLVNCDTKFIQNSYGIFEPENGENGEEMDIVIVPMLAHDSDLVRLGRGGGYYDRYLSQTKATKIGFAFAEQYFEYIPKEGHDVSLDIVVNEEGVLVKK